MVRARVISHSKKHYRIVPTSTHVPITFKTSVDKLSYKQLIRVVTVLNANTPQEKAEANRIIHALVPDERIVLARTLKATSKSEKRAKIGYLRDRITEKNREETGNINTDAVLLSFSNGST